MTEVEIRSIFMEHSEVHNDSACIFTNGSKSSAGVGYGVFSIKFRTRDALPDFTSIFMAELLGILNAIGKIATMDGVDLAISSDAECVTDTFCF